MATISIGNHTFLLSEIIGISEPVEYEFIDHWLVTVYLKNRTEELEIEGKQEDISAQVKEVLGKLEDLSIGRK